MAPCRRALLRHRRQRRLPVWRQPPAAQQAVHQRRRPLRLGVRLQASGQRQQRAGGTTTLLLLPLPLLLLLLLRQDLAGGHPHPVPLIVGHHSLRRGTIRHHQAAAQADGRRQRGVHGGVRARLAARQARHAVQPAEEGAGQLAAGRGCRQGSHSLVTSLPAAATSLLSACGPLQVG